MIDESEFTDVAAALGRYRPARPDAAKVEAIAAALARPRPSGHWRWWSAAVAAIVVAGIAFWAWPASHQPAPVPTDDIPAEFSQAWFKQTRVDLPWQTPQKPVVVTVFLDWMCVGCFVLDQNLIDALEKLDRIFPGRITVVFEDWPWDRSCNAAVTTSMHPGSCELARAVRRARERGRAAELIAWLRDHQKTWKNTGLPEEFRVNSTEEDAAVRESIARGRRVKVSATPTTFINGVRTAEILPAQQIEWAIRLELARADGKVRQ
jgi:hypothetical protein